MLFSHTTISHYNSTPLTPLLLLFQPEYTTFTLTEPKNTSKTKQLKVHNLLKPFENQQHYTTTILNTISDKMLNPDQLSNPTLRRATNLRMITNQPRYPLFNTPIKRYRSFLGSYPSELSVSSTCQARNGFFYTGKSSKVIFFSCGGFKNLIATDNISEIHAQFFGGCEFLKQQIGLTKINTLADLIQQGTDQFISKLIHKTFLPASSDLPGYIDQLQHFYQQQIFFYLAYFQL